MAGSLEQLAHRGVLDDEAVAHDDDATGDLGHQAHVVPDHDQAAAHFLLHEAQGLHHLALVQDIERAGRLVRYDQARLQRDGDGDAGPLLHPARELVREQIGDADRQADAGQDVLDKRKTLASEKRNIVIDDPIQNLVANAQHRIQRVHGALRHIGDELQPQPRAPAPA